MRPFGFGTVDDMLDMSWGEVMLIGGVALIVIGPKDLPKALRTVGQVTTKLRRMAGEFQMQFNEAIREAELDDVRKEVDGIRDTVRSASGGFNPVQTIRDELKGAVEGRAKAEGVKADTAASAPAEAPGTMGPGIMGPERPDPEPRALADATAQLRAEQDAAQAPASGDASEPAEALGMASAEPPGGGDDGPPPIPGSVEDPYGPPQDPAPVAIPHEPSADPKHGTAGR